MPVTSYLAAPVLSRTGEVLGGLFFGHSQPARFSDRHERMLIGVAAQGAIAIDNARLYERVNDLLARERDARAVAETASRAKDEFLAMLGHELRNPLAPILTALQLMELRGDRTVARAPGDRAPGRSPRAARRRSARRLAHHARQDRAGAAAHRSSHAIVAQAIEMASPLIEQSSIGCTCRRRATGSTSTPIRRAWRR